MANQWFRLYSEFATDPKVQMMSEAMQRRYIMLLCMRCSNNLVTLHDEEVAFQLRINAEELAETKELFIKKGFVTSTWDLPNWEKRQFPSDTSASRVAKHRALQKEKQKHTSNDDVTLQKQKGNALEQNRTDTDKKNTEVSADLLPESPQPLSEFLIPLNDSTEFAVPEKDLSEWTHAFQAVDVPQELRQMRAWVTANPTKRKTRRGVSAFIVRWLSKAQDMPSRNSRPVNSNSEVFV